ncbi:unnamed protein product [Schistocephalus solidus]|uniref:DUF943 family protein n=1 Tax=Schistocephalus solidus TaxID=70667 RepID=A0A183SDR8_SCHSO|nr:unnamed protein product [Schistocephalus solidus]
MMRKVVVLAILANLALADVWLSPVETDKSGRQYITFDGKRYDLRDGESPVETLVWKDCVVELDLSRTPNTPYENYRQGSRFELESEILGENTSCPGDSVFFFSGERQLLCTNRAVRHTMGTVGSVGGTVHEA